MTSSGEVAGLKSGERRPRGRWHLSRDKRGAVSEVQGQKYTGPQDMEGALGPKAGEQGGQEIALSV